MPEMLFRVRWPDESVKDCYSPSRAIAAHLQAGQTYPLDEFLARSRDGLRAASDRVRELHGFPCSRAAAQLVEIERTAALFAGRDGATVTVEAIAPL